MARERGLFATKTVEEIVAENESAGLSRSLGPWSLASIGIAGIIGAGIFGFLGSEARAVGPAVTVSIILGAIAVILAAFAFAELATLVPASGSAYAYAFAALGRLPAFLVGWFILNSYAVGNMAVAGVWSEFVVEGLASLNIRVPALLAAPPGEGGIMNLPAALIMVLVTILILPRIGESTTLNNILVGFKLLVVLLIIGLGLFLVDTENYSTFNPGGTTAVFGSAAVLLFAYLGFDTVAAAGGEARSPRRDLPIGILASVIVSALLYVAMAFVITGMQPHADLAERAPVATAFSAAGYPWASAIIAIGSIVALTTVMFAFQLGLTRVLYGMAHDGFLPRYFDRVNARTGTPWRITFLMGAIVVLGAAFVPVDFVADMTVETAIAMYMLVSLGVLMLKLKRPDLERPFSVPWPIPVLAIIVMLAIVGIGFSTLIHLTFLLWLGLGLLVYGFYGHKRSLARDEERDAARDAARAASEERERSARRSKGRRGKKSAA